MSSRRKASGKPGTGVGLAAGLCLAATFAIVQTTGLSLTSHQSAGPQAWMAPDAGSSVVRSVRHLIADARSSVALPASRSVPSHPVNVASAVSVPDGLSSVEIERSSRLATGGLAPLVERAGRFVPVHVARAARPHLNAARVHSTLVAALAKAQPAASGAVVAAQAQTAPIHMAVAQSLAHPNHSDDATAMAQVASASAFALAPATDAKSDDPLTPAAADTLSASAAEAAVPAYAAVPSARPETDDAAVMELASAEPVSPLAGGDEPAAPLPAERPEAAAEVEASSPSVQAGEAPMADDSGPDNVPLPSVRPERPAAPAAVARVAPSPQPAPEAAPVPAKPMTTREPQTELAYAKVEKPSFGWGNIFGRHETASLPGVGSGIAVYDIENATVYMPNGQHLEAHSGLGRMTDNPRYVKYRNTGPTPPGRYNLVMRENLFHGVQAVRMLPADGVNTYGRDGFLTHTYMLRGRQGESNGCVVFKNYKKFLTAFKDGRIKQIVVVPRLSALPEMIASR